MDSVGGARTLKYSSDELVDHVCSPCKEDGTTKEAKFFCPECSDYLCQPCENSHLI